MDDDLRRELDELRADVDEHDAALMELIRGRPRRTDSRPDGETNVDAELTRLDLAATAIDRLGESEQKLWERLLKLAPSTRSLIAALLELPSGDERCALAYCLNLDGEERSALLARIVAAEQEELEQEATP